MADDIIVTVDEIGRQEGMPDGIQFQNMHRESTFSDLYADEVGHDDDDSCASDDNWKYTNKAKGENDMKLISDMNINDDKLEGINDIGEDDNLLLNGDLVNEEK